MGVSLSKSRDSARGNSEMSTNKDKQYKEFIQNTKI